MICFRKTDLPHLLQISRKTFPWISAKRFRGKPERTWSPSTFCVTKNLKCKMQPFIFFNHHFFENMNINLWLIKRSKYSKPLSEKKRSSYKHQCQCLYKEKLYNSIKLWSNINQTFDQTSIMPINYLLKTLPYPLTFLFYRLHLHANHFFSHNSCSFSVLLFCS